MPTYRIVAKQIWDYYVDADSQEEAIQLADENNRWYKYYQTGFELVSIEEVKDEQLSK
jgi:hypothetical protein